jgi:predicted nucleic acid-binding protein
VREWVIDASLTLQWFLEDDSDRAYSLAILKGLSENEPIVPILWYYEVGNGLTMAHRRKRITFQQVTGFLNRLELLPIRVGAQEPATICQLPNLAQVHKLTNYDVAYLELAMRLRLPLATNDRSLKRAAAAASVTLVQT